MLASVPRTQGLVNHEGVLRSAVLSLMNSSDEGPRCGRHVPFSLITSGRTPHSTPLALGYLPTYHPDPPPLDLYHEPYNDALFVKNLSYNVTPEELFDLFGKFGPVRQIRQGIANNTKGTAFVVYEDVMDAKQACDKLNGFNFQNRYLVVLYHQPEKMARSKEDLAERQQNLENLKRQHGIE
ncbi:hypothetical protein H2199_000645 [Coniosporium tulheliwenetii]|uniref:Uncharacterized protein n=1 Tax=Coniosporium tulheliwenetii TaxID=3383036 RepID=A0ACC2ZMK3_9PEZI|nr:hypothetical protein H2199_000645 [Cladosporium sp. JES 115]